ncbi:LysR substrate-binding domain-containing protein [Xinfangfangia sp. CPCC 101601]|uniref:LysR substrate-binding domain-containing protein n=1 Tax=Pseudogemmobacter lacusdianii TaxID=3069608 RepID=A0ABU0VWB9_9RHOB|nr:LysR substrate-binding domain-containing protein [Xinfangfangia sp. CPCC 101601]MDQ2066056.1 LysR substrate-binding domain-containing protein [Xinfangfangia sp. CPCC 101601]
MSIRTPRRFLPSVSLLAAFEAAARTGSITEAAAELSLTQSAVSRQIKALEDQLGLELFIRAKQKIQLTFGGQVYAREIREALGKISSASLNLLANPSGGTLTISVPPTFGARWLTRRLHRFTEAHPEVMINVLSRLTRFDFREDVIDAAIHFGDEPWTGVQMLRLRGEVMIPVCAPELAQSYGFAAPADVRRAPLLHLTTRPDAWERWLEQQGVDDSRVHGMLFDQFSTLYEAAAAGLGVALLPEFLFTEELRDGRIVPALPLPMESAGAYHLCWPIEKGDHPLLAAFRDWLVAEMTREKLGRGF